MGGQIVEVLIPKRQFEDGYQWVVSPRAGIDTTYETSEGSINKGAPALESRTEGRLVSPTAAAEKKNCTPNRIWLLTLI